jgi:pyruvate dehydrogenase E1 component beta subunit
MADLITYREAVATGIAQEMRRDDTVVCLGEDIGAAEGVFKTAAGLFAEFGPERVWDTPISEQAIVGAAMGAAMTGLRPVAEIMFSDFLACCWDYVANEIPKVRYMTGGQVTVPLVVRTANGGGLGFGAQHSQAVENWAFAVPGLKIAAPSTPADMVGLMAAAIRSDDPVLVFEHKSLFATKGQPPPSDDHVVPLGEAEVRRPGGDVTLVALASTVPTAMAAAEQLATDGVEAEVIDLRCLIPLDARAVLGSVARTSRLVIVEENPYQGAGAAPSPRSSPKRPSTTSTPPSAGSPAPASPSPSPPTSRKPSSPPPPRSPPSSTRSWTAPDRPPGPGCHVRTGGSPGPPRRPGGPRSRRPPPGSGRRGGRRTRRRGWRACRAPGSRGGRPGRGRGPG